MGRKRVVNSLLTLDGVMQAPGAQEDPTCGVTRIARLRTR
jgi:hypothetical protein